MQLIPLHQFINHISTQNLIKKIFKKMAIFKKKSYNMKKKNKLLDTYNRRIVCCIWFDLRNYNERIGTIGEVYLGTYTLFLIG